MLSSPHKTWLLATLLTTVVAVDISTTLGNSCKTLESSQMLATHIPLKVEFPPNALYAQTPQNTTAKPALLLKPPTQLTSKLKSMPMDPWKPHSMCMRTSSVIQAESINTSQEDTKVDTPSRPLDGDMIKPPVLTIGFKPTHGVLLGEKVDSSESLRDNAALTQPSTPAHLKYLNEQTHSTKILIYLEINKFPS